jgi:hypothetical protein
MVVFRRSMHCVAKELLIQLKKFLMKQWLIWTGFVLTLQSLLYTFRYMYVYKEYHVFSTLYI